MNILLTGASGFIGRAVYTAAQDYGMGVRPVIRNEYDIFKNQAVVVQSIDADTDWSIALVGIDVVIHCAARVQVMTDSSDDAMAEFRRINVYGTLNLARQAVTAGAKRFIFVSSIKVNGETTNEGCVFCSDSVPAPQDAYGISKAEAEEGLRQIAQETGLEVVIIRPPLVYGPGVKGNFSSLMKWINQGFPLPLSGVNSNHRSLVALDNLVDLILTCVDHPQAANQTFLVSDGQDISTAELLRKIGNAMSRPARLFFLPPRLLAFAASLMGKRLISERLTGSLQVDIKNTRELLNWTPPISLEEGLRRTVEKRV